MMEIKRLFLLILEIVLLIAQCFILFHYYFVYESKYHFKDFMKEIESYKGNDNCKYEFRHLFGNYSGVGILFQNIFSGFVLLIHIFVGIMCLIGVIINIISLIKNVKFLMFHIVFFEYALVVALIEFIVFNFYESADLNSSISSIQNCSYSTSIESKISLLKKRLLIIRIYSAILLAISIFHFILTFVIKKIVEKSLALNIRVDLINPEPNLDNDKNEENTI